MAVQKQRVLSQAAQMEKEQFQRILQVSIFRLNSLLLLLLLSIHRALEPARVYLLCPAGGKREKKKSAGPRFVSLACLRTRAVLG